MSIASLTPLIREALGISNSYDATTIPAWIKGAARRLLRDYNFPKSVKRQVYNLTVAEDDIALPAGVGKILGIRFYNPADDTWSEPLKRRDGLTLPTAGELFSTQRWWREGNAVRFSSGWGTTEIGLELILWYQTVDPDADGGWIYDDFEDVLYPMVVYREAPTVRKPEVQQAFAPRYQEELSALAIYLNELEWQGVEVNQREDRRILTERYPAS